MENNIKIDPAKINPPKNLARLSEERLQFLRDRLTQKEPKLRDLAQMIHGQWGECLEVSRNALLNNLFVYRSKLLGMVSPNKPPVPNKNKQVEEDEEEEGFDSLKFNVQKELIMLIDLQKTRINNLIDKEKANGKYDPKLSSAMNELAALIRKVEENQKEEISDIWANLFEPGAITDAG